jgi:hypothetical protein
MYDLSNEIMLLSSGKPVPAICDYSVRRTATCLSGIEAHVVSLAVHVPTG